MEMLSKPVRLTPQMARVLDLMRTSPDPYPTYNQPAQEADERVLAVARSLLTDSGLSWNSVIHYTWYAREVAKLFRTRSGRDLAFHLELIMRKWQNFGLSPNILQILACEVHNALKPNDIVLPMPGGAGRQPARAAKPRKGSRKPTAESDQPSSPEES